MPGVNLLVILLLIGILARSNLIATAACILLVIKFSNLSFIFPLLEKRGLELGLLFLLLSILVPVATGKITEHELLYNFMSLPGILTIIGGVLATFLNREGLKLLQIEPEVIFGHRVYIWNYFFRRHTRRSFDGRRSGRVFPKFDILDQTMINILKKSINSNAKAF